MSPKKPSARRPSATPKAPSPSISTTNGGQLRRGDDLFIDPRLSEQQKAIAEFLMQLPDEELPQRHAGSQTSWIEAMRPYVMHAIARGFRAPFLVAQLKERFGVSLSRRQLASYIAQWEGRPNMYLVRRLEDPILAAEAEGQSPRQIAAMLKERYQFEIDESYLASILPALRREVPAPRGRRPARAAATKASTPPRRR